MSNDRQSDEFRRSSGVRFAVGKPNVYARYAGFLACVAMLPLAIAGSRMRGPGHELIVAKSMPVTLLLPDSSRVVLHPQSSLRVRRDFAQRRRLWVAGGADVDIVPGAPFSLWTETGVLSGTGASFIVNATGLATTHVTVTSGSVVLRAMNEDNDPAYPPITLQAGQSGLSYKMVGAKLVPRRDQP